NNLLPIGIPGQLCTTGSGVARGYLNRPQLTAKKFTMPPAARGFFEKPPLDPEKLLSNARLYRTGDLAKWLPDGNIQFLGRVDQQVKIRGYRIEPGEIENQLLKHQDIIQTIVLQKESKSRDKYLCAYIVPQTHERTPVLTPSHLRDYLSKELPVYMVPSYFVVIDKLPLMFNGKINRNALPQPDAPHRREYAPPRDALEKKLLEIWSQVLEVDAPIGIHDNFFELGGH
ncbi:MAG: AMP-binding protein, partial [bacterium]|nr:AMP-binding protein [bacterium]